MRRVLLYIRSQKRPNTFFFLRSIGVVKNRDSCMDWSSKVLAKLGAPFYVVYEGRESMQSPLPRPKKYNIMSTAILPFRQFPCFTRCTDHPDFHSRFPVNRTFKGSRKKFESSAGRSKKNENREMWWRTNASHHAYFTSSVTCDQAVFFFFKKGKIFRNKAWII